MITINLAIDKRRSKRDGSYPLVFRVTSNSSTRSISTKFSTMVSDWNNRSGCLKSTHPLFEVIAPRLKELEIFYMSKIIEYEKLYPRDKNIQRIKVYLSSVSESQVTIYSFWQDEIDLLHKSNRSGGALVYEESLKAIHKQADLKIPFEQVDYTFLRNLEASFSNDGLGVNSIGIHMRSLRAVFNKAIKSKIITYEHYPFASFKIKRQATTPRPITCEELRKYFNLQIDTKSWLYDSWLLGKLMFMLIGINFKDMVLLSESNIKDGRINYIRSKTKTVYTIRILQDVVEILEHFKSREKHTLLGKLTKEDLNNKKQLPLIIKQKNKVFNAHLNRLGKMICCKTKLTGYVFRYSWANIAKSLGYSKDMIAEALGHQYGSKVTGIYLESYDKELIDEMNHVIHLTVTMPQITPAEK